MEILRKEKQIDSSYSDEDLFVLMSFKKDNEVEAQEAFQIFYYRYSKLLWSLCYSVCTKLDVNNGKEFASYIFSNTMTAIYEHPTYDASKSKLSTWMSRIAYHEALDLIKEHGMNNHKVIIPINEEMTTSTPDNNEVVEHNTPQKKILDEALNLLTERDREILFTCIMHQEEKKHLPDEVLMQLSNRYNTTPVNIRQIKKRALDKVKAYISQNSNFLNN